MDWDEYLIEAIRDDDLSEVEEALAHGANPNVRGGNHTVLHWAVFSGKLEIARTLLESGAKVSEEAMDDNTALHAAVEDEYPEMVELLLKADGPTVLDCFDYIDRTPLMIAVERGRVDLARLLIEAGADVNAHHEARIGNTALRIAAEKGWVEMTELLLNVGADPLIPGWMGLTALDKARQRKRPEGQRVTAMLENAVTKRHPA
jgi:ankyrin repeat protein